jgi:hypothetical protein
MNNDLGNYTKPRQDQNVNLRVAKKSKQMLVQNRIPTPGRIKKRSVEVTISQQYSDGPRQNRQRQK